MNPKQWERVCICVCVCVCDGGGRQIQLTAETRGTEGTSAATSCGCHGEGGRKEASERRVNYHSAGCTDTVSPSPANQCCWPSCTHKEGNDTPVSRLPASGR